MDCKYSKKCKNHCPNCGSKNVDWLSFEIDDNPFNEATCNDCGCSFQEVYSYTTTYFDEITNQNNMSDEEMQAILNLAQDNEKWDEFETIKDTVTDMLCDLPIEVYEHLFKPIMKNPDKFVQYLLKYKD